MDVTTAIDRSWLLKILVADHKEAFDAMVGQLKANKEKSASWYKGRKDYAESVICLITGKKYQNAMEIEGREIDALRVENEKLKKKLGGTK